VDTSMKLTDFSRQTRFHNPPTLVSTFGAVVESFLFGRVTDE